MPQNSSSAGLLSKERAINKAQEHKAIHQN